MTIRSSKAKQCAILMSLMTAPFVFTLYEINPEISEKAFQMELTDNAFQPSAEPLGRQAIEEATAETKPAIPQPSNNGSVTFFGAVEILGANGKDFPIYLYHAGKKIYVEDGLYIAPKNGTLNDGKVMLLITDNLTFKNRGKRIVGLTVPQDAQFKVYECWLYVQPIKAIHPDAELEKLEELSKVEQQWAVEWKIKTRDLGKDRLVPDKAFILLIDPVDMGNIIENKYTTTNTNFIQLPTIGIEASSAQTIVPDGKLISIALRSLDVGALHRREPRIVMSSRGICSRVSIPD